MNKKQIEVKDFLIKNRILLVKRLTSLFFIIGLISSYNLWISNRNFPTAPVFNDLFSLPAYFDIPVFIALIIVLFTLSFKTKRIYFCTLFFLLGYLLVNDQMRWQPWVYTYILFLVPFALFSKMSTVLITNYLQILLIGIYIWSGIHKLNPNFNELIVESFTVHLFNISNTSIISTFKSIGFVFATIEILAGLCLIVPKTRKIGVTLAIGIHVFIILYISPIGINYNYIILPWNVFMAIVIFTIFNNSENHLFLLKKDAKVMLLNTIALIVITLPILNFFNLWDSYLSFSLYSGKINNYYVLIKEDEKEVSKIYDYEHYYTLQNQVEGGKILDIDKWAMQELNVPMIPEDKVFKQIAKSFCSTRSEDLAFVTTKLPLWKLMFFDFYRTNKSSLKSKNSVNKLFFIKLKKPLKNIPIKGLTCSGIYSKLALKVKESYPKSSF